MVLGQQVRTCNALKVARLTYSLVLPADPLTRSHLVIERRMNDISNMVKENKKHSEERHRQNKEQQEHTNVKWDQVLAAVAALTSQLQTK
jgi:hypothetical protein